MSAEVWPVRAQDRRKLLSEACAAPALTFGTIINSSTVTFESSTRYSSISRVVAGGFVGMVSGFPHRVAALLRSSERDKRYIGWRAKFDLAWQQPYHGVAW
jgi:hypothetical protein